jgi:hypothetical protein
MCPLIICPIAEFGLWIWVGRWLDEFFQLPAEGKSLALKDVGIKENGFEGEEVKEPLSL